MKVRAYQKGQLAQMYYPWCGYRPALRRFACDLERALTLRDDLRRTGWVPHNRIFTPQQVQLIFDTLGDPRGTLNDRK